MGINYGLLTSGGTATGSPNVSGYTPAKVFDGYRHTQNDFGAATAYASSSGASSGNPITIVRDLGQNRVLNAINIFGLRDSPSYNTDPTTSETATNYTLGSFVLDYSTDGTNWTTLSTITGNTKVRRDFTYSNFTARYVRLTVTSGAPNAGGTVYLVEFEILGDPPPDTTAPSDVTNLTIDAGFNINSDAAADNVAVDHYRTQYKDDSGAWTDYASTAKSFVGNQNLLTAVGTHTRSIRRKAVDAAGNESANWSNVPTVNYTVTAPVTQVYTTKELSKLIENIPSGKTVTARVRAVDKAGNKSEWSNTKTDTIA